MNEINFLQYSQCQYKILNLLVFFLPVTEVISSCPHFLSPLCKDDICFDRIPIPFKDTLLYVDPITRQTYDYATPITCENNPRNIIELDPDSDDQDFYILGPEPIKRKPPLMFTPSQIKTTIRPNTFTAQDACIYSKAELDQFWNRILFSKHSDSTFQLLAKALSYSFISSNTPNYDADSPQDSGIPYNTLRIGLHDKLLNLTPLFTPKWFSDAFLHFRIPLLHSHTMWYILFYISFCTSYSHTHCQTLQNNIY